MALSYPLAFPTINGKTIVENLTMRLVQSAAVTTSSTSFVQQVQDFGVARWEAEITIRPLDFNEARVFQAFIAGLRGVAKTFTFGDPQQTYTSSVPVCTTSGVLGATDVAVTNSSSHVLKAGTQFSLYDRLYVLLEDAPANTTTNCSITPPLRGTFNIPSTSLDITYPVGIWRLASNDVEWRIGKESLHSFTLACVEAS
jgi:hypothetical protein